MSRQQPDRAEIVAFPPLILIATIVLAMVLQRLMPLGVLAGIDQAWRIIVGALISFAGMLTCLIGRETLIERGTNVNPLQPTTALATEGIYRWTRNPIYVGGTALMLGIAIIFGVDWLMVLISPSVLILHFGVVMREEQYLERKFEEEYRRYKALVPRYLWPASQERRTHRQ